MYSLIYKSNSKIIVYIYMSKKCVFKPAICIRPLALYYICVPDATSIRAGVMIWHLLVTWSVMFVALSSHVLARIYAKIIEAICKARHFSIIYSTRITVVSLSGLITNFYRNIIIYLDMNAQINCNLHPDMSNIFLV